MKKPDPVEKALDELRETADVAPFLKNRNHRVVAKAAERAGRMTALIAPELVAAFRRLLPGGAKMDPGCVAKLAVVRALVELEDPAAEIYFAGVRYEQPEPVWGSTVDTAAELRGLCAIGLARMSHPEALLEAVRLLSDSTPEARMGALRALADSGKAEAELVLRFKADCGDKKAEVLTECFAALLRLGPRSRAAQFVAGFLQDRDTETAEAAAIALGESRIPEAWPLLRDAFTGSPAPSAVILGIALLRNDEAIEFLFQLSESGLERVAAVAIEALAPYRGDGALRTRMESLIERRKRPALGKVFRDYWA
jgi:HEAT repeat protein